MGVPKKMICHDLPRKNTVATVDLEPQHMENTSLTDECGNSEQSPRLLIDIYNNISALKDEFYQDIMADTRRKIAKLIAEADPDFKRNSRNAYLKSMMEDLVFEALYSRQRFERYLHECKTLETILEKEDLDGLIKKILKAQAAIISLRKPEKPGDITDDMVRRAKEFPWDQLVEVGRSGMAICPFHNDRDPSFSVKNNYGFCFGCKWKGDQISFLMEKEGLSFPGAIERLQ